MTTSSNIKSMENYASNVTGNDDRTEITPGKITITGTVSTTDEDTGETTTKDGTTEITPIDVTTDTIKTNTINGTTTTNTITINNPINITYESDNVTTNTRYNSPLSLLGTMTSNEYKGIRFGLGTDTYSCGEIFYHPVYDSSDNLAPDTIAEIGLYNCDKLVLNGYGNVYVSGNLDVGGVITENSSGISTTSVNTTTTTKYVTKEYVDEQIEKLRQELLKNT